MSDPTPTEIDAGERAVFALLAEHHGAVHTWRTVVDRVLRAVLPDHDAWLRAETLRQAAGDIRWRLCGGHRTLSYTDGASDAARLLENLATDTETGIARAHTTGGTDE